MPETALVNSKVHGLRPLVLLMRELLRKNAQIWNDNDWVKPKYLEKKCLDVISFTTNPTATGLESIPIFQDER
jgi:hypothetical protein